MKIIGIEDVSKTKCRITIEGNEPIVLYKTDLRRYHICEGEELEEGQIKVLVEELLPYRAKMRCMKLLQSRDYTEYEIRQKLIADGYPDCVIDTAVNYLYEFKYLDDDKYVRLYYQSKCYQKSKKQIILDLQRKGIAKETILSELEAVIGEDGDGDYSCIFNLLKKKRYVDKEAGYEEKEKLKAYLFRKGFEIYDINVCMRNFSWKNM